MCGGMRRRMDTDQGSYKRATAVALIGLAMQLSFGVLLLLYGLFAFDSYAYPAAFAVLLASPLWVLLALVFHQHKRERVEAMEAEAFAEAEGAAASVFEEAGADQVVEARRLAWMHTWLLPAASVVIGVAMVGVGLWVYSGADDLAGRFLDRPAIDNDGLEPPAGGVGLAIGAIGALVSFVFARYVAGMAKERVWLLLNGGAGAAVQMSLLGALIAVAHFLHAANLGSGLLQWLPAVFGIFMIAQGAEIFLNFLLNLYRPRTTGDYLRPAFDSRVLAYVAAPDRLAQSISEAINYQFGFSVSSTWFYRLLSRWVVVLALLLIVVAWLTTSLVVLKPNERGILLQNGVAAESSLTPGLVVKAPWPMDRVVTFPATAVNEIGVGTRPEVTEDDFAARPSDFLWSDADIGVDAGFIVNPVAGRADEEIDSIQRLSVVTGFLAVRYVIDDVAAYYGIAQDGTNGDRDEQRRRLLEVLASSVITREFGERDLDGLVRGDWSSLESLLAGEIQSRFDAAGAGVRVVGVGVEGLSPPQLATGSIEDLTASKIARATTVQKARSEADGLLAVAAGDADTARAVVAELEELSELEAEARELRRAGSGRLAEAQREIERRRRQVTRTLIESGGRAAQILAQASAERWETEMRARGEQLRAEGRQALYDASPSAFQIREYLEALRRMAGQQRVFVMPGDLDLELDVTEVSAGIDIGPAPGEGGDAEN